MTSVIIRQLFWTFPCRTLFQSNGNHHPEKVAALAGNVKTDVNSADLGELMTLRGIGPVLAGRIILRRPFSSVEELVEVCGIGPITLDQMLPFIDVLTENNR